MSVVLTTRSKARTAHRFLDRRGNGSPQARAAWPEAHKPADGGRERAAVLPVHGRSEAGRALHGAGTATFWIGGTGHPVVFRFLPTIRAAAMISAQRRWEAGPRQKKSVVRPRPKRRQRFSNRGQVLEISLGRGSSRWLLRNGAGAYPVRLERHPSLKRPLEGALRKLAGRRDVFLRANPFPPRPTALAVVKANDEQGPAKPPSGFKAHVARRDSPRGGSGQGRGHVLAGHVRRSL